MKDLKGSRTHKEAAKMGICGLSAAAIPAENGVPAAVKQPGTRPAKAAYDETREKKTYWL